MTISDHKGKSRPYVYQDTLNTALGTIDASLQNILIALGGEASSGEFANFVVTIAAQDTAQVLTADQACRSLVMVAFSGNAEIVAYGGSTIDADSANSNAGINGAFLYQGQGQNVKDIDNLNKIYISGKDGDKILVTYSKTTV